MRWRLYNFFFSILLFGVLSGCTLNTSIDTLPSIEEKLKSFSIELNPDGTSGQIQQLQMPVGATQTFYSILRNRNNEFLANETVSWSMEGSIGALTIIGDGKGAEFNVSSEGTATIRTFQNGKELDAIQITGYVENKLLLQDLVISNVTDIGFKVTAQFNGDSNSNSSVALFYCNHTDSPGCDPETNASNPMSRSGQSYELDIGPLTSPFDPGETLKVRVIASDADGTVPANLEENLTLMVPDIGAFNLTGITGANDTADDAYLVNGINPKLSWGTSAGATSYDVVVLNDAEDTEVCALVNVSMTEQDFSACTLTAGNHYKAKVTAKVGPSSREALNSPYRFYVNQSPVLGADGAGAWYVMSGTDLDLNALWAASPGAGVATDPEGDTLVFTNAGSGSKGTTVNNGTSLTYSTTGTGTDSISLTVEDDKGGILTTNLTIHIMTEYTWTGLNSSIWNTKENWCGSIAVDKRSCVGHTSTPGSASVIYFDDTCESSFTCTPVLDVTKTFLGVRINANGFSQASGQVMNVGNSGWVQTGGAFTGSDSAITINRSDNGGTILDLSGGVFNSTSGVLKLSSRSGGILIGSSVTFNSNSGKVLLSLTSRNSANITLDQSWNLYDFEMSSSSSCCAPDTNSYTMNSGSLIHVANNYTVGRDYITATDRPRITMNGDGTIEVLGDIEARYKATVGTAIIKLTNSSKDQYYKTTDNGYFSKIHIDKSAFSVIPEGSTTFFGARGFSLINGSFRAPSGTMSVFSIGGNETLFDVSGGTTFDPNGGSLLLRLNNRGSTYIELNDQTLAVNNLTLESVGSCCFSDTNKFFLGASEKFNVLGDLQITATGQPKIQAQGGAFDTHGSVIVDTKSTGGSASVNMVGVGDATLTVNSTFPTGNITINKDPTARIDLLTNLTLTGASQNLTINSGVLDLGAFNLTVPNILTIESNGTLDASGGGAYSPNTGGNFLNNGTVIP